MAVRPRTLDTGGSKQRPNSGTPVNQRSHTSSAHIDTHPLQPSRLPKVERPAHRWCQLLDSWERLQKDGIQSGGFTEGSIDEQDPRRSSCGHRQRIEKVGILRQFQNRCSTHIAGDSLQPILATANLYDKLHGYLHMPWYLQSRRAVGGTCSACCVAPFEQRQIFSVNWRSLTETV